MSPRLEVRLKEDVFMDESELKKPCSELSFPGHVVVVDNKKIIVNETMVSTVTEYLHKAIPKAKRFDNDEVVILAKPDEQGPAWEIDSEGIKPVTAYASITTVFKAPKVQGFQKIIR